MGFYGIQFYGDGRLGFLMDNASRLCTASVACWLGASTVYYHGSGTTDTGWLGPVFLIPGRLQLSCSDLLCCDWIAVVYLGLVQAVVALASHLTLTDT